MIFMSERIEGEGNLEVVTLEEMYTHMDMMVFQLGVTRSRD